MNVRFATDHKAMEASSKHFNSKLNIAQMRQVAALIIKKATYVGKSDRANAGHSVARIVWSEINGTTYAVVLDGNDVKRNIATVVSMYDVTEESKETKIKRFNMKKV